MSTNDEIRKAVDEAAESVLQRAYGYWEGESAGSFEAVQYYEQTAKRSEPMRSLHKDFSDRILTALAPYLAPHPAQQGEDGELLDWLDKNGNWWAPGRHVDGYERISRAAIRAARARSHSKQ